MVGFSLQLSIEIELTSFHDGSDDGGGGATTPMEDTFKPVAIDRLPETAACPRSLAMFFKRAKSSSSGKNRI